MTIKNLCVGALLASLALAASAQQANNTTTTTTQQQKKLNKEITLDKDVVPVEKKATKKNTLPKVKKSTSGKSASIDYSDWAVPTPVPVTIPTMLPYGYRTQHIFSDQRGYLVLGAGSQLNFDGSVGYRAVDTEDTKLQLWLQHNSTWTGRNSSPLVKGITAYDPQKQKYNNNVVGIDLSHRFGTDGTLTAGFIGDFDKFNYYGCLGDYWEDNKQGYTHIGINAGWTNIYDQSEGSFNYKIGAAYNYAGYSDGISSDYENGAKESSARINLGGEYMLADEASAGAEVIGDIVSRNYKLNAVPNEQKVKDDFQMITVSPFYRFHNDVFSAKLGVNVNFSFSDGAAIRLSPAAAIDLKIVDGANIFVEANGGKRINHIYDMQALNRYSDPLATYRNTYSPIDAEAGFKIGPFSGFQLKLFAGYGVFKNALMPLAHRPLLADIPIGIDFVNTAYPGYAYADDLDQYAATVYHAQDARGVKFGAAISYNYREKVIFDADITATTGKDTAPADGYYKGYVLGLDMPQWNANVNLKVKPIRKLTVNAGLEMRGNRHALVISPMDIVSGNDYTMDTESLEDVFNLKLGADYRLLDNLSVWARAENLLNKQYDVLPGMGVQKLNIMGGISLNF